VLFWTRRAGDCGISVATLPGILNIKLFHSGRQLNGLAVNHERAAAMMMDGAGMFL
jgi:hypothetical protein